jgi:hypothetical protein
MRDEDNHCWWKTMKTADEDDDEVNGEDGNDEDGDDEDGDDEDGNDEDEMNQYSLSHQVDCFR